MARVSIFFIVVALIAGMVGCIPAPVQYTLSILSTQGGTVTTPGEGTSSYPSGAVVLLVAAPLGGYNFVNWTGNVATIANANAASTTITMNGHYFITANFFQGQVIRDWYDLHAIRNNLGENYLLTNDLDSATAGYKNLASKTANDEKGWQPIGTSDERFTGTFYGQGYKIKDLFIGRPEENYVGLFGYIDEEGIIENVGLVNAAITGKQYVGDLVGANAGDVSESYSSGSVRGDEGVGGLVGWNGGTVGNSYSIANVSGDTGVGGLVGSNDGTKSTVKNSYSSGSVTGAFRVGGLMGLNEGITNNCYSSGSVTGTSWVGGLVGENPGTVSNSFWDTETSGISWGNGGTGKTTGEMRNIATFTDTTTQGLEKPWDIIALDFNQTNITYIWNIVDGQTYPFLSWERPKYNLTISSTAGGSVTTPGEGTFTRDAGTVVSLVATPNNGYQFVKWTGDVSTIDNIYAASTNITMHGHYLIIANFVAIYDLTMAADPVRGEAIDLTNESPYPMGTEVEIKAIAKPGWAFVNWTAPAGLFGNATAPQTTFTMPAQDVTVTANFVAVYYLTMASNPVEGGIANDLTDESPYAEDTEVSIKAEANEGYEFVNWTAPAGVFGNATAPETAFTMPAQNVTVTANFS